VLDSSAKLYDNEQACLGNYIQGQGEDVSKPETEDTNNVFGGSICVEEAAGVGK